jgi:putative ABC transport system permease protein
MSLAVGIGATTAVFSTVYGVLLSPLPYPAADRLVRLSEGYEGAVPLRGRARLGSVTYHAWKDGRPRTVAAIEGYTQGGDALLEIAGTRALTPITSVTPGLLDLVGASVAEGRLFTDNDAAEGAEPVVVLSDRLWRERFGADAAIVGGTLVLSGQPRRIIGVTDPGFAFPDGETRIWSILDVPRPTGPPQNPRFTTFLALARLMPGATPDQASAEGTAIARDIDPKPLVARLTFGDGGSAFVRATPMLEEMTSPVQAALTIVAAGIACVFLIVCVNLSNLLLSRGAARYRELAVRAALGASRPALARQLLAETLVLSLAGGAGGVILAFWLVRTLPLLAPADFPRIENVQLDVRALGVAVLLSLLTGLLSALAPIAALTRANLARAFRGDGTSGTVAPAARGRTRSVLLASESAFAVVLLVAAVLLGRSFEKLIQVDAGYTRDGVVVADVLRPDTTQESAQRFAPLMRAALDRVRALPGVVAAGIASMTPLDENNQLAAFPVPGTVTAAQLTNPAGPAPNTAFARLYLLTPGSEPALGLRLRAGRFFTESDAAGDDARWIVNEEFARLYLPADPVGRRFPWRRGNQDVQLEIVGVVGNVLKDGNTGMPSPEVYRILRSTDPFFNYQIVTRTNAGTNAIVSGVRNAVLQAAPDATVIVAPLSQRFSESVAQPRLAAAVFGALAILASSLTAIGLFAALSYSLSLRRREFGVRAAVGATRVDLVRMAVRQGITPTVIGILIGVAASAGVTRFMQGVLFGITPLDAFSFVAAPSLLVPVALAACLLPAFRAARVDPVITLRAE